MPNNWPSDAVTVIAERSRVDLLRLLTGLRHLAGSTEPATDGPCDIPETQRQGGRSSRWWVRSRSPPRSGGRTAATLNAAPRAILLNEHDPPPERRGLSGPAASRPHRCVPSQAIRLAW